MLRTTIHIATKMTLRNTHTPINYEKRLNTVGITAMSD